VTNECRAALRQGRLAWGLATLMVLAGVIRVTASVVVPMSLEQLTEAASRIVEGTVADVRHVSSPEGVERLVLVRIDSTWKGTHEDSTYVRLSGGRIGRIETRVPGVPDVEEGDRLVWFLAPHPRGGHVVLGLHQGMLATQDAAGGDVMVVAPARTATVRGDVRRLPRRLADLASDVREMVAAGERP
jgi:hypothetical protein